MIRVLEELALSLAVCWLLLLIATFVVCFVESWTALWRRLDRLARERRRWWGPS